ncbi:uncharacterized protein BDR25DRAFT_304821 [Lindgomyces ingoldianus]|uniref:Uncharacterized protein n=1 Tax=Lindgomyces ingoldianus TaxID=673940 RepID=A0ACB6QQS3_9PLEO|nr:uncharacterized protein BDR25DRAFT_304821 [Lindgomyces ingoldianus]KAF2468880.1 hypothetical protein BDR25DRAFT_304821 [Lindgomyces ingoldianus]
MVLPRPTTLRASSIARFARIARHTRTAELQPWQRMLQRTGCRSYASAHGHGGTTKSDIPWAATAVVATAAGLYFVTTQDLGHGEEHGEHHGEKHEGHEEASEEKEEEEESSEDSKDSSEDGSKAEKPTKEESPDKSDKPDPRKEPKSSNETSGKQEGLSNTDTKHSTPVSENPDKSKKGEGVAETAKAKGTISTDRPPAENKEERGKGQ